MMDPDAKQKWIEALRSGEYQQGQMQLRTLDAGIQRHCCLGVLCDVMGGSAPDHAGYYGTQHGLTPKQMGYLTRLNDEENKTFGQIADFIEAFL